MAAGDTVASNNVLTVDPDKIGAKLVMRLKMINNLSRIVVRFLQYRMVSSLYHLIPRQFRIFTILLLVVITLVVTLLSVGGDGERRMLGV